MEQHPLSVSNSFFTGWGLFKKHAGFLVVVTLVYLGISFVPGAFNKVQSQGMQLFITAVMLVISSVVAVGVIQVALALYDGAPVQLAMLFHPIGLFIPYLAASLLTLAAAAAGFVLLIVPGIIISARLSFYDYIIAEYETGPVDALRYSWRLTAGATLPVILFSLAAMVINMAGLLLLGVGLFATLPVTMMARTHLYRVLQANRAE